ncbi:MAG: hypothetical protein HY901_29140, partial [Deltaproteobacteria bacterium]|nr:hypothetical protein [Deltaproteobacteria bacterium]
MRLRGSAVVLSAAMLLLAGAGSADERLPKKFTRPPWSSMSLTVGHPNDGWQL